MFDVEKTKKELKENIPEIIYYRETDSTNQRAKEYAKVFRERRESVVFIADSQTAGRGRLGRRFHSADGAGLYITFLLYPDMDAASAIYFTPYAAVKLSEAVEETAGLFPRIKWVNDLYINGKKLAGILVESQTREDGKIDYLICGLGINVYKTTFPQEISDVAISIEEVANKRISRETIASTLIEKILSDLGEMASKKNHDEYERRLTTIGKDVTVIKPTEKYDARVKKLNPDYSLTLSLPDGSEEILFTGEVGIKNK